MITHIPILFSENARIKTALPIPLATAKVRFLAFNSTKRLMEKIEIYHVLN